VLSAEHFGNQQSTPIPREINMPEPRQHSGVQRTLARGQPTAGQAKSSTTLKEGAARRRQIDIPLLGNRRQEDQSALSYRATKSANLI
jgi:hypothetical protein